MNPTLALGLFGTLGPTELIVILLILVLIFGATKLPQLGSALGKTIRGFKNEMKEGLGENGKDVQPSSDRFCGKCGAPVEDAQARFCPKCGAGLS
ncbi:MAG: twin-arginine translocase TatA/TatE family subunit [Acidobacteriota bacterium]